MAGGLRIAHTGRGTGWAGPQGVHHEPLHHPSERPGSLHGRRSGDAVPASPRTTRVRPARHWQRPVSLCPQTVPDYTINIEETYFGKSRKTLEQNERFRENVSLPDNGQVEALRTLDSCFAEFLEETADLASITSQCRIFHNHDCCVYNLAGTPMTCYRLLIEVMNRVLVRSDRSARQSSAVLPA